MSSLLYFILNKYCYCSIIVNDVVSKCIIIDLKIAHFLINNKEHLSELYFKKPLTYFLVFSVHQSKYKFYSIGFASVTIFYGCNWQFIQISFFFYRYLVTG